MACSDYTTIWGALADFGGDAPLDAVICPFTGSYGMGMGMGMFVFFIVMPLSLALSIRVQHPGPVLVVAILSAGLFVPIMIGAGGTIYAIVLFFGIAGVSFYLYQQAKTSL